MSNINLHATQKRLAVVFTLIVFVIAFFLELTYFSLRYYNISYNEKKEFAEVTKQISFQVKQNPDFFKLFITEGIKFKPPVDDNFKKWRWWPERWFKFLNFVLLDKNGNVVAQNFTQDIAIHLEDLNVEYDLLQKTKNGMLLRKINVENVWENFKDLVFIKMQWYDFFDYGKDIFLFLLVNIFFSIFFYFIGLFFVGKNLKPIEQTLSDMNDFIHNANHELKTPIAVVSSNLQMMKATKNYEEELVLDSVKEIKRIDELIVGLSNLSDINVMADVMELDVETEIKDIIEELKNDIAQKNISLDFKTHSLWKIKANKQYFYIVFSNLLRNAIKYNDNHGKIEIVLQKSSLTISNTWDGIPQNDIPFVFDRFYQVEKSRNTQGFWIGLSLVKKICDTYNWKISVTSNVKETTTFTINFK